MIRGGHSVVCQEGGKEWFPLVGPFIARWRGLGWCICALVICEYYTIAGWRSVNKICKSWFMKKTVYRFVLLLNFYLFLITKIGRGGGENISQKMFYKTDLHATASALRSLQFSSVHNATCMLRKAHMCFTLLPLTNDNLFTSIQGRSSSTASVYISPFQAIHGVLCLPLHKCRCCLSSSATLKIVWDVNHLQ